MEQTSQYTHRVRPDGTVGSICTKCFATVANEKHEENLVTAEDSHDCLFPKLGETF